jgi:hypothetical protein
MLVEDGPGWFGPREPLDGRKDQIAARGGVQAMPASRSGALPDLTALRPRHDADQTAAVSVPLRISELARDNLPAE